MISMGRGKIYKQVVFIPIKEIPHPGKCHSLQVHMMTVAGKGVVLQGEMYTQGTNE